MKIIRNIPDNNLQAISNYFIEQLDLNLSDVILSVSSNIQMNESSDITFYELRKLLTILKRTVKDVPTKNVLESLLQAMTYLEIRNVPIPTLLRQLENSSKVFKTSRSKNHGKK